VEEIFAQSIGSLNVTIAKEFTNIRDLIQDKQDSHHLELAISHVGVSNHYTGLAKKNLKI
jgi:hypothetical protein